MCEELKKDSSVLRPFEITAAFIDGNLSRAAWDYLLVTMLEAENSAVNYFHAVPYRG